MFDKVLDWWWSIILCCGQGLIYQLPTSFRIMWTRLQGNRRRKCRCISVTCILGCTTLSGRVAFHSLILNQFQQHSTLVSTCDIIRQNCFTHLTSQKFLNAGENFWKCSLLGWRLILHTRPSFKYEEDSTNIHYLLRGIEGNYDFRHDVTAKLECKLRQSGYFGREDQEQAWTRTSLVKDCARDVIRSSLRWHIESLERSPSAFRSAKVRRLTAGLQSIPKLREFGK